jgi:septum formation protein
MWLCTFLELGNWRKIMISYKRLVLASASPRRKQMLENSGIEFIVMPADIDEKPKLNEKAQDYVLRNAREKAQAINFKLLHGEFILSADTVVVTQEGLILEKPSDAKIAKQMLIQLSGKTHYVYSGYALYQNHTELVSRVVETQVNFRTISDREQSAYIATGEPFDKAGGYGIQGHAMGFIECIKGSYTNVMGLPLSQVLQDLENFAKLETFTHLN